ncbi:polysaccharide deacetylase family protein [Dethiobacter alkaliphilus]|uniref:Polysaccharide deacetylase n=1 Tax=Dethiobacter alkaliphilus AHT 1 TaxID=555088 RepID=C0GDB0_DETAL|nr:polysaccharide deacetylase family protein [Dethiobacter alkaliphilus]EEG78631.1 polysaccharide deacetylase [Dethiobacter alkaliphilus AHT 1]
MSIARQLYRVQAGAFSSRQGAEEQVKNLKEAGFDAFIISPAPENGDLSGQKLYRVQAGAFSSKERAKEQVRRLKEAGFDAFFISPQPPEGRVEPETPAIYVGQQLIIPFSENDSPSISKVVNEGILKQIALTFDAGWYYDQTIPLLDELDKYNVKSTFFPRALWVRDNPDLTREIVNRGHIVENHSLTHADMSQMNETEIREELGESTRIIEEITNRRPYLFRPPYGAYNERMLKILAQEGYPYTIMWTVDSHDWAHEIGGKPITADYLVNRVLDNSSPNGIILMHVGGYNTVKALPRIITGLMHQGYRLVTVNEMMPAPTPSSRIHTVNQGETLHSIAEKYGVTVEEIIAANGL